MVHAVQPQASVAAGQAYQQREHSDARLPVRTVHGLPLCGAKSIKVEMVNGFLKTILVDYKKLLFWAISSFVSDMVFSHLQQTEELYGVSAPASLALPCSSFPARLLLFRQPGCSCFVWHWVALKFELLQLFGLDEGGLLSGSTGCS